MMPSSGHAPAGGATGSAEAPILFQEYFKSIGPRTYAVQVKEARNGNHFLVLTEGKRDEKSDEIRKTKLLVFSEDFEAFFSMVKQVAEFVRANPVPPEVARARKKFWSTRGTNNGPGSRGNEAK